MWPNFFHLAFFSSVFFFLLRTLDFFLIQGFVGSIGVAGFLRMLHSAIRSIKKKKKKIHLLVAVTSNTADRCRVSER